MLPMWRNAEWAGRKGLFAEYMLLQREWMNQFIDLLIILVHSNPAAMAEMKKIFWKGTEHWDKLFLKERPSVEN